jgi:precorrin-6A synthase
VRKILLIGIGTGNPEHLTLEAIAALNTVDVVFVLEKGEEKADLAALRREICARFIQSRTYRTVHADDPVRDPQVASYGARVDAWHDQRSVMYEQMFARELSETGTGAILVWGDPSLYDSTLRIIERIVARGHVPIDYRVIPGISSVQVLAARHKLVLNRVGGSVHITTGRRLAEGFPEGMSDVVVMLDGECTFMQLPEDDLLIYWGAYLGSERELLISGPLAQVKHDIERVRAAARAKNGWIMDIYLLRKRTHA